MTAVILAVLWTALLMGYGWHRDRLNYTAENDALRPDSPTAVGHPSARGRRLRVVDGGAR